MDFVYASGRLSVKLAELKKIETQINGLAGKSREEILSFLNHLQLAGNSEMNDFLQIMQGSEKILADELKSLTNESQYYLLDAVFADDLMFRRSETLIQLSSPSCRIASCHISL